MFNIIEIVLFVILIALSGGVLGWFFISTRKTFNKINSLDTFVIDKLLLTEYYMVFARRFTKDELIKMSKLSDEEIKSFNKIHDVTEKIKTAREKIKLLEKCGLAG
ncbi:MAG: hypothetical protein LBB81_08100 [Treponema sp.]|jgi:hypothetical protein|nr:hypothetical protein [Treponema sp.]